MIDGQGVHERLLDLARALHGEDRLLRVSGAGAPRWSCAFHRQRGSGAVDVFEPLKRLQVTVDGRARVVAWRDPSRAQAVEGQRMPAGRALLRSRAGGVPAGSLAESVEFLADEEGLGVARVRWRLPDDTTMEVDVHEVTGEVCAVRRRGP